MERVRNLLYDNLGAVHKHFHFDVTSFPTRRTLFEKGDTMTTTKNWLSASIVVLLFIGSMASVGRSDDNEQPGQQDPAEIAKLFAEYATPGPEHESFKHMVGKWKTEVKSYESPDGPQTTHGSATFKLLLGGRFVQQNFKGEFGGAKFEGVGITGYDNAQKKYVGVWMDSMGTGIMHTEGEFDPKTKTMTETGKSLSPIGMMTMKMVGKHADDGKFLFTIYTLTPEGDQKLMEITYTRVQDDGK